ncbi:MAG: hypothetical protein ACRCXD_00045 [Luteolibacter sp.]
MHNSKSFFDRQGRVLFSDKDIAIHAGNIFRAQTVKGEWNHIVAMRNYEGFIYYMHGDKVKKSSVYEFVSRVKQGELIPVDVKEMDVDRLATTAILLDSVANRRTSMQQIDMMEDMAVERARRGDYDRERAS